MKKVFIRRSRNHVGQASSLPGRQDACPTFWGRLAFNFIGKRRSAFLLVLSAFTISSVCGCGGGASTKPTVTVKPRDDGTQADSNGGTTPANGENAVVAAGFGTFKGVITFDGTPTPMKLLNARKDPICFANQDKVREQYLIVHPENKGIKNVFVYLDKTPDGVKPAAVPTKPFVFDQKFCTFTSHAAIVRAGQTVLIKSDDNTIHNTHTYPRSPRNSPGFNQAVKPGDRVGLEMSFKGRETLPVSVKCDIHTWMTAFILPLDHDFAAVTDKDGKFEIKGLPTGEHEFVMWHEKADRLDRKYKVTIQADQTTEKTITYSADKF